MQTYIRGPGDASSVHANLHVLSVDLTRESARRKYTIILGDGAFFDVKITVDVPDVDGISLRDVFLRAAGLDVEEQVRRHVRTGERVRGFGNRGVML